MIEKDRGKRKGKVELVMHRFLFTFENLMDPFYIFGKTRIIVKCRLAVIKFLQVSTCKHEHIYTMGK